MSAPRSKILRIAAWVLFALQGVELGLLIYRISHGTPLSDIWSGWLTLLTGTAVALVALRVSRIIYKQEQA